MDAGDDDEAEQLANLALKGTAAARSRGLPNDSRDQFWTREVAR